MPSTYKESRRTHFVIRQLLRGKAVTAGDIQQEFGVSQATASKDLAFLADLYDLETFWTGGTKFFAIDGDSSPVRVHHSCRE